MIITLNWNLVVGYWLSQTRYNLNKLFSATSGCAQFWKIKKYVYKYLFILSPYLQEVWNESVMTELLPWNIGPGIEKVACN